MARTQRNKATAHHLGLLKARIAKLRRELITPKGGPGSATGDGMIPTSKSRVPFLFFLGIITHISCSIIGLFKFWIFVFVLGFDVAKTGDARIGFVGFPSVGKSTLLSNLAGVYSEVAAYEFTTLTTVPGVIRYKGAKIQVQKYLTCRLQKRFSVRYIYSELLIIASSVSASGSPWNHWGCQRWQGQRQAGHCR